MTQRQLIQYLVRVLASALLVVLAAEGADNWRYGWWIVFGVAVVGVVTFWLIARRTLGR
jgi:hypothetical protein